MTDEKEITCIICPIGCKILVNAEKTRFKILKGNKCKKGVDYARNEVIDPRRVVTSSVLVKDGEWPLVSVKSTRPIPKESLFTVLKKIQQTKVNAPIKSGQIIVRNAAATGIDIIATRTIKKKK